MSKISIDSVLHSLEKTAMAGQWCLKALFTATVTDDELGPMGTSLSRVLTHGWHKRIDRPGSSDATAIDDGMPIYLPLESTKIDGVDYLASSAFADPDAPSEAEVAAEMVRIAERWQAEIEAVELVRATEKAVADSWVAAAKGEKISLVVDSVAVGLKGKISGGAVKVGG